MKTARFERERFGPFGLDIHPWVGTEHCLREEGGCSNDHTGCMWNDSHNECMHPADPKYVCPLKVSKKNIPKVVDN